MPGKEINHEVEKNAPKQENNPWADIAQDIFTGAVFGIGGVAAKHAVDYARQNPEQVKAAAQIGAGVVLGGAGAAGVAAGFDYAQKNPDALKRASEIALDLSVPIIGPVLAAKDMLTKDHGFFDKVFDSIPSVWDHMMHGETGKHAERMQEGKEALRLSDLTKEQAESVKNMENSILKGDLPSLKDEIQKFAGKGADLAPIMAKVKQDMLEKGIVVTFQHGRMMMGGDKDFHDEGTVTIFGKEGGTALSLSTEKRIGAGLGGPVRKTGDGQYIDMLMGLPGDPAAFLKTLVDEAHKNEVAEQKRQNPSDEHRKNEGADQKRQ